MPSALRVPRINTNEDFVQVTRILPNVGDRISSGDIVAEVESDKSTIDMEAERDGYVIQVLCEVGEEVSVGSVMMWIGDSADEEAPAAPERDGAGPRLVTEPTAKARALLDQHGLDPESVPHQGSRLTAGDVEDFIARGGAATRKAAPATAGAEPAAPTEPGQAQDLSVTERGMLRTVTWHRDEAVPAYLEIDYDPRPWEAYAAEYGQRRELMLSPLLALIAHRLTRVAAETPRLNTTLSGERRYVYEHVNLGFTVQSGDTLYLVVVKGADELDDWEFVQALGELQRRAIARKLRPEESQGATLSFSSMARWSVRRHVPVLPPHNSLIVAHTAAPSPDTAVLGATYDHRVLSGFDVAAALTALSKPPSD